MAIDQLIAAAGPQIYENIRRGVIVRPEEARANRLADLQLQSAEQKLAAQNAEQNRLAQMRGYLAAGQEEKAMGIAPEEYAKIQEMRSKMDKANRDKFDWTIRKIGQASRSVEVLPQEQRPAAYKQALASLQADGVDISNAPPEYDPNATRQAIAYAGLPLFQEVLDSQGQPIAQRDVMSGQLSKHPMAPESQGKQTTTEFERLLAMSGKTEEEKDLIREQRLSRIASGDSGFSISVDKDGEVTMVSGGGDELTKAQAGKAKDKFIEKTIQARKFVGLSNRIMQSVKENSSQLGVVGAIARIGDEVKSIAKNVGTEFGVDVSGVSKNAGDYDFGSLASESAAFKTNALSLALIFASASGLGEGRALTDKDVQRAIDVVGASTNSPEQLFSRMGAIQQNLQRSLQIEAEERKYDFEGIPEMDASDIPDGVTSQEWQNMTPEERKLFK